MESSQDETCHPAETKWIGDDVVDIEFWVFPEVWIQVGSMVDKEMDRILSLLKFPIFRVVQLAHEHVNPKSKFYPMD